MQRLEVSCAVRPLYGSLGVKGLNNFAGPSVFLQDKVKNCTSCNMQHHQILLFLFVRDTTIILLVSRLGVEGPRQSPSLTVCSFLLWGWAREKACRPQPRTLDEAEQKPFTYLSPRFPRRLKKNVLRLM